MAVTCGRQTVTDVGKPVRLVAYPKVVLHVDIFALDANMDRVYVGCKNVRATTDMESGWPLSAKEAVTFKDIDLSTIWLDARIATEGVSWGAEHA